MRVASIVGLGLLAFQLWPQNTAPRFNLIRNRATPDNHAEEKAEGNAKEDAPAMPDVHSQLALQGTREQIFAETLRREREREREREKERGRERERERERKKRERERERERKICRQIERAFK